MIPDSVCSCPSASMVTAGAGSPSIACVGRSPISVQIRFWWWFGLEFFVEFVIVAERGFGQIVGVLGVQHAVEFANNLHVDLA